MTEIRRRRDHHHLPEILAGRTLLIRGGWTALIPEVEIEAATIEQYAAVWRTRRGLSEKEAYEKAWLGAQRVFRGISAELRQV